MKRFTLLLGAVAVSIPLFGCEGDGGGTSTAPAPTPPPAGSAPADSTPKVKTPAGPANPANPTARPDA
jgi:hypothetical protein